MIVVETFDEDGATWEEFSLASKEDFGAGLRGESRGWNSPQEGAGRLAAVDRTKAAATIKGGREALEEEAVDAGICDDKVASGDTAIPPLPQPSPTRPTLTTTRLRAAGAAVPPRPPGDPSVPRSSSKPTTKMARPGTKSLL
jgi:hypothetical protein